MELADDFILLTDEVNFEGNSIVSFENVDYTLIGEEGEYEEMVKEKPQTFYPCKYCDKTFTKLRQCYGHQWVHSKQKLWNCAKCPDIGSMTKEQFTTHQSTHAPQDRNFGCSQCTMTFATQVLLERHVRDIHNRERSYKCKICEKAFFSKSDLQIHLAVHTGDQKYECTECSRKFKHVSNFLRHMRTHTGCKPYICSICEQRFNQIATLRRHKKSKHQECLDEANKKGEPKNDTAVDNKSSKKSRKSYCGQCGETFSYHSEMIYHLESIHYVRNRPESANEMLNEIVQDFNKNAGTLGESVDALIKGIFNEDSTIDVDSIIVNNVSSLYSDKANLPSDFLISNSDSQEALEMPYFKIPDYPMNPDSDAGNIKLEVSDEYSQNLIESEFGVAGDSSICNELGVSMLQDIEQYLPPRTDSVDLELPSIDAECATIFESDVDLDQSSLLAENLNQLIEQNGVQFISADDSDTYIISLNSSMDAEKLSSFLNIENLEITTVDEPELINREAETTSAETAESALTPDIMSAETTAPKIVAVQNSIRITNSKIEKKKPEKTTFECKVCNKTLKNKYNFRAHLGTHYKKYRKFKCQVCKKKFSWQSTLNKHTKAEHALQQSPLIKCDLDHCSKYFKHKWQIAEHKRRDHNEEKMYRCLETGCSRSFFKKSDLRLHLRTHTRERPYSCHRCPRRFSHPSHLRRHERMPHDVQSPTALLCRDCGRAFHQPSALNNHKLHCCKQTPIITTPIADLSVNHLKPAKVFDSDFSTQLLSDIEDVLKIEMTVKREG